MRYLITIVIAALSLNAFGQTQISIPYNPDGNADGLISLNDLLDILAMYGNEFSPDELVFDDHSAILHLGSMDYFDCASSCEGLQGNWKLLDEMLIGRYKTELSGMGNGIWLDRRVSTDLNINESPLYSTEGNYMYPDDSGAIFGCVCQTRVVLPVLVPVGPCETGLDLCGVCGGPGPIYECGCHNIPEGACDCEGNQLDALGICGGDCLGDYNGDGICDVFPEGACQGQNSINYQGFDYDIVEIGGECWFADDLRTENYTNGDEIQSIQANDHYQNAGGSGIGGWSAYEGYEYNGNIYNWYAVLDSRGLCPSGWKVPSRQDYINLADSVFSDVGNNSAVNSSLKDDMSWNGNNSYGFTARITIYRNENGSWISGSNEFNCWSSDYGVMGYSYYFRLIGTGGLSGSPSYFSASSHDQKYSLSIRCIKD